MAFDPVCGAVVMFGGQTGAAPHLNETWFWNGIAWVRSTAAGVPPRLCCATMAFDGVSGRMILFGGNAGLVGSNQTWAHSCVGWTLLAPSTSPSARWHVTAVWDETRRAIVLFGGDSLTGRLNDTWEWTGSTWIQIPGSTPSGRYGASLVYDSARQHSVLFGGVDGSNTALGDLWEYGNRTTPAYFERYGTGCGIQPTVPSLDVATTGGITLHPYIGSTYSLTLANLPANAPPAIDIGLSRTNFAGFALPLDLTPFGMTSCFLYQDRLITFGLANVGGSARFDISVPNARYLVGRTFFQQGFALHAAANPLGVIVSNGTAATIGAR